MVLDSLGNSLKNTLKKIASAVFVNDKLIDELIKDIQRALLQADVNVKLVFNLTKSIKERALNEKTPAIITKREHLVNIVYEELVKFLGNEKNEIKVDKKPFKIMLLGLFGSGKCVHKDSKIPLSNGEILSAEELYNRYSKSESDLEDGKIIDVQTEELFVPSFNPQKLKIESKKVTHLWKLDGKSLLQVYLNNGNDFSVRVTLEHPFFVLRKGKVEQIRADSLTEDDVVAIPSNYSLYGKEQDFFSELKKLDIDVNGYYLDTTSINIKKKLIPSLPYSRNYCQLTEDLKKGITPICLVDSYNKQIVLKKRAAQHFISFPTSLTEELAEFLGYIMGDGHLDEKYVDITNEDSEVIQRVIFLTRELFGLNTRDTLDDRTKDTHHLRISSTTLVNILHTIFGIPIGKKGRELKVSKIILQSPLSVIKSFLRAYFDCDAYAALDNREIEISSESKNMIMDTSYLLHRFGILSSIRKKLTDGKFYWYLTLRSRYAELYASRIGFTVLHKKKRIESYALIGEVQGCGKQDMIALGQSLKELRHSLGFSIGEIQEYVTSYGMYEKKGLISRESLAKVLGVYLLKKKGSFFRILDLIQYNKPIHHSILNGFLPILRKEGFIQENNNQIVLTKKALAYKKIYSKNDLLEFFKLLVNSDVSWISVKKIENIGTTPFVYDLTVEDNHSFIADNIIVHNTTSSGKLALYYAKRGHKVAVVGLDVHRPAAASQLEQVAKKVGVPSYINKQEKNALKIYKEFEKELNKYDLIIIDTAGRDALSLDLIKEIESLNKEIKPDERILVISADIGQAALTQAEQFHKSCNVSGVLVTKLDGTARAGGALSACSVSGAPIKFIGTGEKMDDLETFNPKGFVSRLLGMGDLEALLEKAKEAIDQDKAEKVGKKMLEGDFNFLDLYEQLSAMKKMGPLNKIFEMIPGMGNMNIPKEMLGQQEGKLEKWKIIMSSMTRKELENPDLIDRSRIDRIGRGGGVSVGEVRELIKQYNQSKKMMKLMKGSKDMDVNKLMKKFKGKTKFF